MHYTWRRGNRTIRFPVAIRMLHKRPGGGLFVELIDGRIYRIVQRRGGGFKARLVAVLGCIGVT